MNKLLFLVLCFFCFISAFQLSNAQVNDAGLWMEIKLNKKLNKKFSVTLAEEIRLYENYSEVGSILTELSAEYKIHKSIDADVGYRFTNKRRLDDSYSKRHRYFFSVSYSYKLNQFRTSFRLKYLSQYADLYSSEDGNVPKNYLRTKLSVKYDTNKKYTPYLTGEMFYHVNNPEGWLFDNYRITAGVEYEFTKRSQIELRYLINKEIQVNDPWTLYVLSIGWNYKL